MERPLQSKSLLATLFGGTLALLCCSSAFAADCARKPNALDQAICGNADIKRTDDAINKLIGVLYLSLNGNGGREYATIVADQLRWREDLLRQCTNLAPACLLPKYRARLDYLKPAPDLLANELYLSKGIKVGGYPLELRSIGKQPGVYIGEQQISGPVLRIDIAERYTDSMVDALVFVANRGGDGGDCAQFPVYIVTARPGLPPDYITIPNILGSAHGQLSCIDRITRGPDGLLFEIDPWPWVEGRTYSWKPKLGLSVTEKRPFFPIAGTRMSQLLARNDSGGRLDNEQFYESLRKATTALDLNFPIAAEAFWFSWNMPYRRGDYVVLESCSRPGRQGECTGSFVGKAVYEQRTDKIFFAFSSSDTQPACELANGRDPINAALSGVLLTPPRYRWPNGALYALRDVYCPNNR